MFYEVAEKRKHVGIFLHFFLIKKRDKIARMLSLPLILTQSCLKGLANHGRKQQLVHQHKNNVISFPNLPISCESGSVGLLKNEKKEGRERKH